MDDRLKSFGSDPVALFEKWYIEAKQCEINDPDAMCLATADSSGKPSNRMVLLKDYGAAGFKFHTNSDSQKGLQLSQNPFAALCFHWKSTRKQIRIEGSVEMVDTAEADEYFRSRPRARQIGAWASAQSQPLESRDALEKAVQEIENIYKDKDIPRPPYWNGYRVIPQLMEFWIGHRDRLHDRFVYLRQQDGSWAAPHWLFP
jgi:pyridoxamine 5'-phosphate oxidase